MTVEEIKSKMTKKGICIYAGLTEYFVYICEDNVFYGTGDHEDIPEVENDKEIRCYTVYYSDIQDKNVINASAGQFESYGNAVKIVESDAGFLRWID